MFILPLQWEEHAMSQDKTTVLSRLDEGRVFYIRRDGEMFVVCEACDDYFGERLTRDELRQLASEIMELANG